MTAKNSAEFRVLHLIPTLQMGGAERLVAELTAFQANAGWDVAVAAAPGPVVSELSQEVVYFETGGSLAQRRLRVGEIFRDFRPTIVHAHSLGALLPCLDRVVGRYSLVLTAHNSRSAKAALTIALAALPRVGAAFVSPFPWRRAGLALARRGRLVVIPNGIAPPSATIEEKQRHVVWIGRLAQLKNPVLAIEVFEKVAELDSEVSFELIGDGPLRATVEARWSRSPHRNRIELTDRLPHQAVSARLRQASVILNTSHSEGDPMTLIEAAVAGVAIVCPNIRGLANARWPAFRFSAQNSHHAAIAVLQALSGKAVEGPPLSELHISATADRYEHLYRLLLP